MWLIALLSRNKSQSPWNGLWGPHELSSPLPIPTSQHGPDHSAFYSSSVSSLCSSHTGLLAVPSTGEGYPFLRLFPPAIFPGWNVFPHCLHYWLSLLLQLFAQILMRFFLIILVKIELSLSFSLHTHTQTQPLPHTPALPSSFPVVFFSLHLLSNSALFHLYILLIVYKTQTYLLEYRLSEGRFLPFSFGVEGG